MRKQITKNNAICLRQIISFLIFILLFCFLKGTVLAADPSTDRAVTVLSSNNSLGAVWAGKNGQPFEHYIYASDTDTITVSALPVNKRYDFRHWTDNGTIVSHDSSYTFTVKDKNHVLIAVFEAKPDFKDKRYKENKSIPDIKRSTNPCNYADGYKLDGLTPYTALAGIDAGTKAALEAYTSGTVAYAFHIQLIYGYNTVPKETWDPPARLVITLPEQDIYTSHNYQVATLLKGKAPIFASDLDKDARTVTFEAPGSGYYILIDTLAKPAAPPA